MKRGVALGGLCVSWVLAAACGDDGDAVKSCGVVGQVERCVCIDDLPGVHRCDEDGTWDACDCATSDGADGSDGSGVSDVGSGGSDGSESSGTSGSPSGNANASDPITTCDNSLDCVDAPADRMVCDSSRSRCVQCVADADCDPDLTCASNVCGVGCDSDNDCTPLNLLCDLEAGVCVELGDLESGGSDLPSDGGYLSTCDADSDCDSGHCYSEDVGGFCSVECTTDSDCDAIDGFEATCGSTDVCRVSCGEPSDPCPTNMVCIDIATSGTSWRCVYPDVSDSPVTCNGTACPDCIGALGQVECCTGEDTCGCAWGTPLVGCSEN